MLVEFAIPAGACFFNQQKFDRVPAPAWTLEPDTPVFLAIPGQD